jgi:hypothetical protein
MPEQLTNQELLSLRAVSCRNEYRKSLVAFEADLGNAHRLHEYEVGKEERRFNCLQQEITDKIEKTKEELEVLQSSRIKRIYQRLSTRAAPTRKDLRKSLATLEADLSNARREHEREISEEEERYKLLLEEISRGIKEAKENIEVWQKRIDEDARENPALLSASME